MISSEQLDFSKWLPSERTGIIPPFTVGSRSDSRFFCWSDVSRDLAFGQPRQAELVDHLLECNLSQEEIRHVMETLMINLSPIRYGEGEVGVSGRSAFA